MARVRHSSAMVVFGGLALWGGAACDLSLVGEPGGDGAPTAVLTASALAGQAPLEIVLDATDSAPFVEGAALEFEFDADGDGSFEVARSTRGTHTAAYDVAGTFEAAVRVRGEDGRFDIASVTIVISPENAPRTADIDVDSDADGAITGADEGVEDEAHAPFLANVDDDSGNGVRDRQDSSLNPDDEDMASLIVRHVKEADGAKVFLAVSPRIARERTRVWLGDEVLLDIGKERAEVPDATTGDVALRLESQTGRTNDWDGLVTITLRVEDGGDVISEDTATMRAAPVIFPDNLQAPQRLFVMNVRQGPDNNQALISAFADLPDGVELYTTDGFDYGFDRWMQDNWEVGYQAVPTKDGAPKVMVTALQLTRSYGGVGLENFVPGEWLGTDRGFFAPGGGDSSHNYGGNLEVAPPTARFPFGRMLYGGGNETLFGARNSDTMNREQVTFLDAQEIQGPALELSSEWLAVGHIDEIFQFVPDLTPAGPHPFKVVIASPDLARTVLASLRDRGLGDALAFEGRSASYSVDQMLDAEEFNALNDAAQRRIDEVQDTLKSELGLTDDDFRRVPVLFNEVDSGLVAAFNPGIQNLVTVGDRLFVPDPEGPRADGQDAWQEATLAALADTDLDVIFVDVFESYHELLGEAHCGTNLERAPYEAAWWTAERGQ